MRDTNEYEVQGMTCSGCATKPNTAVDSIPGVVATDEAVVRATITDAGYQVD